MYSWNYGLGETRRLVNVFRPTVGHPYQVLNQPGIKNHGPKWFGYYVTDDFGNLVPLKNGWADLPFYS